MVETHDGYSVSQQGALVHLRWDGTHANALGAARYAGIRAVADEMREDQVLLLSAAGPSFSAGQNLHEYVAAQTSGRVADIVRQGTAAVLALLTCRATVVAAVQGPAVGGGAVVAAAADIVLLGPQARIRLPELELGMPLGASVLERLVGGPASRRLALTGEWAGAEQVASWGGSRIVTDAALLPEAEQLCATLLAGDARCRAAARRLFGDDERARAAQRYRAEVAVTLDLLA